MLLANGYCKSTRAVIERVVTLDGKEYVFFVCDASCAKFCDRFQELQQAFIQQTNAPPHKLQKTRDTTAAIGQPSKPLWKAVMTPAEVGSIEINKKQHPICKEYQLAAFCAVDGNFSENEDGKRTPLHYGLIGKMHLFGTQLVGYTRPKSKPLINLNVASYQFELVRVGERWLLTSPGRCSVKVEPEKPVDSKLMARVGAMLTDDPGIQKASGNIKMDRKTAWWVDNDTTITLTNPLPKQKDESVIFNADFKPQFKLAFSDLSDKRQDVYKTRATWRNASLRGFRSSFTTSPPCSVWSSPKKVTATRARVRCASRSRSTA